jgi:hypothetical protein
MPTCRMMLAPMKLSEAVVTQSSGDPDPVHAAGIASQGPVQRDGDGGGGEDKYQGAGRPGGGPALEEHPVDYSPP